MFKNLKAKVKQEASLDSIANVKSPQPRAKPLSDVETASNSSKVVSTDDAVTSNHKQWNRLSSSEEKSSSSRTDESVVADQINDNSSTTIELSQSEIELIKEKNQIIVEKLKFQSYNETLLKKIDKLNEEIQRNEIDIDRYKLETQNLYHSIDEYKQIFNNFELDIKQLKNEKDELIIKNAELSQKYEQLVKINKTESTSLLNQPFNTNRTLRLSISESDNAFEAETVVFDSTVNKNNNSSNTDINSKDFNIENNQQYQQQLEENKSLRADLNEKNKMIKNLQQRLNDIKKTLQKELKYQNVHLPNEKVETKPSDLHKTASSQSLTTKPTYTSSSGRSPSHPNNISILKNPNPPSPVNSNHLASLHDDVNFKYLKHVVLKFLCSREYEALHLIKALSVLLQFSSDEEKILKETLEWKMSWFGTRPKIQ